MTIAAGTVLAGRYRVIRPIGSGGMGEVYEAEQTSLGRRVAVKVLFDDDEKALARFEQEARAMAKLTHPHIVSIIDFHHDAEEPLLVMELLEGESLLALLVREKSVRPARAVRIAIEMLDALGAAHEAGIIHRDIKPSNVFLVRKRRDGEEGVRLVDFGIAKLLEGSARKTTTGEIVGTPSYLSPEQLFGERPDGRTDLRAVGLCLFEMLTGRRPWRVARGPELAAEIVRDEPLTLEDVGVTASPALSSLVARAIARDREARFPDARAMRNALIQLNAAELGRVTVPVAAAEPSRAPAVLKRRIVVPPVVEHASPMRTKPRPPPARHAATALVVLSAALLMGAIVALASRSRESESTLSNVGVPPSSAPAFAPAVSAPPLWPDPHHPEDSNDTAETNEPPTESAATEPGLPTRKGTKPPAQPSADTSRFDETCRRVNGVWVCTPNRPKPSPPPQPLPQPAQKASSKQPREFTDPFDDPGKHF